MSPQPDQPEYRLLPLTDWATAFARPHVDALVDGLLFPGRWTALVAPAKVGKSTLAMHVAHCLARGREPFTAMTRDAVEVLYLDGEMGELDVVERLEALDLSPADLCHLHYTDMVPKGDTVQGGAAIVSAAHQLGAGLVVLDGLNAFVSGAEKDDTTWRALFDHTIAPLKRAGLVVLSSDNTGHVERERARGSSVKLDKADGIVSVSRTDQGVKLKCTIRRSGAYLREMVLAMSGIEGDHPITYTEAEDSWPAGTTAVAMMLDRLNVPLTAGRPTAAQAVKQAGESVRTEVLAAAIRYRKTVGNSPGNTSREQSTGTGAPT